MPSTPRPTPQIPATAQAAVSVAYELMERGAFAEAEAACRYALAATNGRSPDAWTALGVVLREQGRFADSESAYRRALAVAPRHVPAHHNLGALLSHLERAEEALAALDRAKSLGLKAPELHINRGRALAQLYRYKEAERAYAQAVALQPRNVMAQSNLAQLRYKMGDPAFARDFATAVQSHPADLALRFNYAELLQRAGDLTGAETALRALLQAGGPIPEARSALGSVLHQSGRLEEAEAEALAAALARPQNPTLVSTLIVIQLARGKADAALPFIRGQRLLQPVAQRWIAYEAVAARMMQDPLHRELYDYDRLVRVYDLEPPPGWQSIAALNEALIEALRARHRLAAHPLDQSLRNGSQTSRSLLTEHDEAIRGLVQAFAAPIESYRAAVGSAGDHPFTARNRGTAALVGCWSVELRRDGYHVNHIHPEGWLSSAYYVSVPEEVADTATRSGWIKFGEPRFPVPGIAAEHFVQPRAGRLVLFPSYMWHGTNAISGDEPRLTVAFDAVPRG